MKKSKSKMQLVMRARKLRKKATYCYKVGDTISYYEPWSYEKKISHGEIVNIHKYDNELHFQIKSSRNGWTRFSWIIYKNVLKKESLIKQVLTTVF